MKKSFLLISIIFFILSSCRTGVEITQQQLPKEIKTYVEKHFPENDVIKVLTYQLDTATFYQVDLNYGVNLEFNGFTMTPTDIRSDSPLPKSVIPEKIREYIEANFPGKIITGWQLDRPNQLIELENKTILEFSPQDDFIRFGD